MISQCTNKCNNMVELSNRSLFSFNLTFQCTNKCIDMVESFDEALFSFYRYFNALINVLTWLNHLKKLFFLFF